MKNKTRGFVVPLLVGILAVIVAGISIYTYRAVKNEEVSNSNDTFEEEKATVDMKTFTQADGIYSLTYPSDWTYTEGNNAAQFRTTNGETIDVGLGGTEADNLLKHQKSVNNVSEVTIGPNKFFKFTITNSTTGYTTYMLPMGNADGKPAYLYFTMGVFAKITPAELNAFLGSVKVYPSKAPAVIKKLDNTVIDARITATMAGFRASAEMYFDKAQTYVGICEGTNDNAKSAVIDKILKSISDMVSAENAHCKASTNLYIYFARLPGGGIICVDNSGAQIKLSTEPMGMVCK